MIKKSLIHSNPYLKEPAKRDKLFAASVRSSTAVEGVNIRPAPKRKPARRK